MYEFLEIYLSAVVYFDVFAQSYMIMQMFFLSTLEIEVLDRFRETLTDIYHIEFYDDSWLVL